jgi:hypothetical protein
MCRHRLLVARADISDSSIWAVFEAQFRPVTA